MHFREPGIAKSHAKKGLVQASGVYMVQMARTSSVLAEQLVPLPFLRLVSKFYGSLLKPGCTL